jgi:hypothetical protein
MAWTLASKQDVIDLHPIPESHLKDIWSETVEALIRQHKSNSNLGAPVEITSEVHSGDGSRVLFVRKPPMTAVQDLRVDGLSLTASDYVVFDNFVQLKVETFPVGSVNVEIDYTSGVEEVDQVVRLTAVAMIIAIINYEGRKGADASLKWGQAENKVGETSPNMNVGLTSHLTTIMKRMLRRDRLLMG